MNYTTNASNEVASYLYDITIMASENRRHGFYIKAEIFLTATTKQKVRTIRGARMDDLYALVKSNASLIAKRER